MAEETENRKTDASELGSDRTVKGPESPNKPVSGQSDAREPIEAPIEETHVAVPVAETPVAVAVPVAEPVEGTPVAVPVAETPVAVPVAEPVEAPIKGTPVAVPVAVTVAVPVETTSDQGTILDQKEVEKYLNDDKVRPLSPIDFGRIRDGGDESNYNLIVSTNKNQTTKSEYAKQQFNAANEERKRKENIRKQLQKQGNFMQAKQDWVEKVMLESIMIAAMQPGANEKSIKRDTKVRCELYFGLKMINDRDYGDGNNLITLEEKVEDLEEKARIEANINLLEALGLTKEDFHVSEENLDAHIEIHREFSNQLENELRNETDSSQRVKKIKESGSKSFNKFKQRVQRKEGTNSEMAIKEAIAHMKDSRNISSASSLENETLKEVQQHNIERIDADIKILEEQMKNEPHDGSKEIIKSNIRQLSTYKKILVDQQREREQMTLEDKHGETITAESQGDTREKELKDPVQIEEKHKELFMEKVFNEYYSEEKEKIRTESNGMTAEQISQLKTSVDERWESEKEKFIQQQKAKVAVVQKGWDTGAKNQGTTQSPRQETIVRELKGAEKQKEMVQERLEQIKNTTALQSNSPKQEQEQDNTANKNRTPKPKPPGENNQG